MKAVFIKEFGGIEKLHFEELPAPKPKDNEVLIKIAYTSVNPVDWKIREGFFKEKMPHEFPVILGWDAAGTITAIGNNVTNFKVGDEVFAYCRKPTIQMGTYAELTAVNSDHVALKPKNINFAEAAAIPLVSLTAWQALFDHAKIKSGDTILIHAGAGGVGSMAIQLAKHAGAKIYATASEKNHSYIKELGADVAIDYHKENLTETTKAMEPKGFDIVFDCVGKDTLKNSYDLVKRGGHLVSIAGEVDQTLTGKHGITGSYCFVAPNGIQLKKLAELIESKKLKAPHIQEMNLSDAAKALEQSRKATTQGKVVLKVAP